MNNKYDQCKVTVSDATYLKKGETFTFSNTRFHRCAIIEDINGNVLSIKPIPWYDWIRLMANLKDALIFILQTALIVSIAFLIAVQKANL